MHSYRSKWGAACLSVSLSLGACHGRLPAEDFADSNLSPPAAGSAALPVAPGTSLPAFAADGGVVIPAANNCTAAGANQQGCPCSDPGATRACWTGAPELRGFGACRDGTQSCVAQGQEFASWGPCQGEQSVCGPPPDAGIPNDCGCVPGAVAHCSEDCSVGIYCAAFAEKVCLPDGTWGPCREVANPLTSLTFDGGVPSAEDLARISAISAQFSQSFTTGCWSRFHGCATTGLFVGWNEMWSGDCAKHFVCGHAPQ